MVGFNPSTGAFAMRRTLIALALLAGCSAPNPATDRLNAGQIVIVTPWANGVTAIKPADQFPFDPESPAGKVPRLFPGDRLQVITDESAQDDPGRPVKIKVMTYSGHLPGNGLVGLVCTVPRHEIRAVQQE